MLVQAAVPLLWSLWWLFSFLPFASSVPSEMKRVVTEMSIAVCRTTVVMHEAEIGGGLYQHVAVKQYGHYSSSSTQYV